ncbi:chromosomal replication initiator protein DnaA [Candidatus Paracaedibacter symbiosus]|uniref:chromosomal replication initiator protein DnaA n=1 Tax=Candidatus Paracaedibacter symbiosus TaxID=244582 RepID=UPI0005099EAA|nr:chromosomal replication initiator protein DnaA [Candidatus Paracaedibacter symbiosus]
MFSTAQQEWETICQHLKNEYGEATFKNWFSPLVLVSYNEGLVQLGAATKFMRDWIVTNYGDKIRDLWQDVNPAVDTIEIIVKQTQSAPSLTKPQATPTTIVVQNGNETEGPNFVESALDSRFTFENFVVGKPNELAYAAALRVAESKTVQFNPLFLYGGVGLGKTHLMHAIAWHIKKCHPDRRVIYLSAEKFMYQFIRALRFKDTVAFKEQFRSVDVLMIDDVQFISGKDTTQEEFFHTFNALVDRNRQLIVSADKSPSDLQGMEERLKSRLGWGLVADIHPTTYELRLGILQAKAESLHTAIPKDVMEFLAYKIASNIRELEGALNRIIAHSTLVGREITLEMTQEVLRDLLKANDRRVTIEDIQKRVAEYYSIKTSDMQSARRSQNVARPRQIAMYLSKILTTRSLPEIGRKFGGRDHTTVIHAVKKVEELFSQDKEFAEDIEILRRTLEV